MKKMSKFLAIALSTVAFAGTFAACGGGDDGADAGCLTITYYDGAYGKAWLEAAADAFVEKKAQEGTEISYLLRADADMMEKSVGQITNQYDLSDIYMVQVGVWTDWVEDGLLEPLTETYETEIETANGKKTVADYLLDGYDMQYWSENTWNDGEGYLPWAMPWSMSQVGLVYNETLMKKIKHTTAKEGKWAVDDYWTAPPETVEDLLAYCADINASGVKNDDGVAVKPFVFPGQENHWLKYLIQVWWAQYQGVYEENTLNVAEGAGTFYDFYNPSSMDVFDQEGIKQGIATLQSLISDMNGNWKNVVANVNEKSVQTAEDSFIAGEAAMLVGGSFMYNEIQGFLPEGVEVKMMHTPTIENAQQKADGSTLKMNYYTSQDYMIVPAGATNKSLAKEFLAFICNEEWVEDFFKRTGTPRPFEISQSVLEKPDLATNSFNQSIMDIYNSTDVKLVSLPATVKNLEDRTPIALYHSSKMGMNGCEDSTQFVLDMRKNTPEQLMNRVKNGTTKDEFAKWVSKYV